MWQIQRCSESFIGVLETSGTLKSTCEGIDILIKLQAPCLQLYKNEFLAIFQGFYLHFNPDPCGEVNFTPCRFFLNNSTSHGIDMKLVPVTKLNKRNTAASERSDNDIVLSNCDIIVFFLIYGQFAAIQKVLIFLGKNTVISKIKEVLVLKHIFWKYILAL